MRACVSYQFTLLSARRVRHAYDMLAAAKPSVISGYAAASNIPLSGSQLGQTMQAIASTIVTIGTAILSARGVSNLRKVPHTAIIDDISNNWQAFQSIISGSGNCIPLLPLLISRAMRTPNDCGTDGSVGCESVYMARHAAAINAEIAAPFTSACFIPESRVSAQNRYSIGVISAPDNGNMFAVIVRTPGPNSGKKFPTLAAENA